MQKSRKLNERQHVLGIQDGRSETIVNELGDRVTPTCITFNDGNDFVGIRNRGIELYLLFVFLDDRFAVETRFDTESNEYGRMGTAFS